MTQLSRFRPTGKLHTLQRPESEVVFEKHRQPLMRTHPSQYLQIFQRRVPRFRGGFCTWEIGTLRSSCVNIPHFHCVWLHSLLPTSTRPAGSQTEASGIPTTSPAPMSQQQSLRVKWAAASFSLWVHTFPVFAIFKKCVEISQLPVANFLGLFNFMGKFI